MKKNQNLKEVQKAEKRKRRKTRGKNPRKNQEFFLNPKKARKNEKRKFKKKKGIEHIF